MTGAARGIGFETARQMHMRGASVAVARPRRRRRRARRPSGSASGRSGSAPTSPTTGAMMAAVAETVERFGGLDVAVANAGIAQSQVATVRGDRQPRSGSGSSRSTCSASGARCGRRCRRSSSARATSSSPPPSTPSPTASSTAPTRSPRPGSSRWAAALRAELAPLGASASVAYFGWVDTQDGPGRASTSPHADRLQENTPDWLLKRIQPDEAGAAIVARHRRAGAADLRAALVALRLGAARADQPAARPAHASATRDSSRPCSRRGRRDEEGAAAVSAAR